MTLRRIKLGWKYRKQLWKYRKLLRRRREIAGVALAMAGIGTGVYLNRHRIEWLSASKG